MSDARGAGSRFLVLEGASPAALDEIAHDLAGAAGWIVHGFTGPAPSPGWRTVRVGAVRDEADAADAVLAAVGGADLVVTASAERSVVDRLCDDLRRLGTLEHRVDPAVPGPVLTAEERALLALLLGGSSVGEAARRLHVSRRTADRRLAAARRALGATSTSEALLLAARAGIPPAQLT